MARSFSSLSTPTLDEYTQSLYTDDEDSSLLSWENRSFSLLQGRRNQRQGFKSRCNFHHHLSRHMTCKDRPSCATRTDRTRLLQSFLLSPFIAIMLLYCVASFSPLRHPSITFHRILRRALKRHKPGEIRINNAVLDPIPTSTVLFDDGTLFYPLNGDPICDYFASKRAHTTVRRIHLHFPDCSDHDEYYGESKSNNKQDLTRQLYDYFGTYLVASAARIPFSVTCGSHHGEENQDSFLSPLLDRDQWLQKLPIDVHHATNSVQDICVRYCASLKPGCDKGLFLVAEAMRETYRELADSLQYSTHSYSDDVVVHLDLGHETFGVTGVSGKQAPTSGLLPHKVYEKLIRDIQRERGFVGSISIMVTDSNQSEQSSPIMDDDEEEHDPIKDRARKVAHDLVEFLEDAFPRAHVNLHNDIFGDASSSKVLSNLVLANKGAICGFSSFCAGPVVSIDDSEAIGYLLDSSITHQNEWAIRAADSYLDIRTFSAPVLANTFIPRLTDKEILEWLRTQDPLTEQSEVVISNRAGLTAATKV